ncbi:MAG: TonB-dependent receptor [Bacteroidia bacterium]|nr:TonB-dependent receptor [Bacteroidia bacterium]
MIFRAFALLLYIGLGLASALAQTELAGRLTVAGSQPPVPIAYARVAQVGTATGVLTDSAGYFRLQLDPVRPMALVFSAEGFLTDTLRFNHALPGDHTGHALDFQLYPASMTRELRIEYRRRAAAALTTTAQQTELITSRELTKAACCNLGESFETNPSVDVNFTDAVSGAKSISLLGLNGVYSPILIEGMPLYQGLGRTYGLNYIPGPWVGSIQVSKGTGPVVLGYESLTGQINIALKAPTDERTLLNVYANDYGRLEANLNHHARLSPRWQATLLAHGSTVPGAVDRNGDGFVDVPLSDLATVFTKLKYQGEGGWQGQLAVQALREVRRGGQALAYTSDDPAVVAATYRLRTETTRVSYFSKTGYVWQGRPYQSVGLQTGGTYHDQTGTYGFKTWQGRQWRWNANLIFESVIGDTRHTYRLGLAYQYDRYQEAYNGLDVGRTESVPGAYGEYTYQPTERFSAVVGLRADLHNAFGAFATPRLNLRYQPWATTTLRLAAGRGYRTANVFAENSPTLTSNRAVVLSEALRPEVGWNLGGSLVQQFTLGLREGSLVLDYYYTAFENQVIVDYDQDPQAIVIGNLAGRSRAHSLQAELQWQPLKLLEAKVAYKLYDVRAPFGGKTEQVMLTPRHRGLVNLAYELRRWRLDGTWKLIGAQRLHPFAEHHPGFVLRENAPGYTLVDGQVTWLPAERWELYLGVENLFNYRQPNPIVDAEAPLGPFFDTSYVWGPILGRVVYLGLRFTVPSKPQTNP